MGSMPSGSALTGNKEAVMAVNWKIGCFSRPWSNLGFDDALDDMQAAGFHQIGLLGDHKGEPFVYSEATPDYLDALKQRCEAHGLDVVFGRIRTRHNIPLEEAIASVRREIDNASRLKLRYLMAFASDKPEEYDHYYRVMADASAYAQPLGIQIAFKPHGG